MEKLKSYSSKYKLGEEGESELIILMNELMKESSNSNSIDEIIKRTVEETLKMSKIEKKEEKSKKIKKYKSRKAEEYAEEHGIEITEFEMDEISKKDVENKIKEKTKMKNNNETKIETKIETKESKKEENVKKRKVICSGINKKGEDCKSTGTIKPEGAKKHYCFRHAEDWKSFECESDSSESEELEKEELEKEELEKEELEKEELSEEE